MQILAKFVPKILAQRIKGAIVALYGRRACRREGASAEKGADDMFADILKHMQPIEFDESELDQPVSLDARGDIATVRDWIAEKAPDRVLAEFGSVARARFSPQHHVRSVRHLDLEGLKRLTIEVLRKSAPDKRVAAIGLGDYTPQQLIEEVHRETEMGARIVDAIRMNALFIESAVKSGKIKPRQNSSSLKVPDFEF